MGVDIEGSLEDVWEDQPMTGENATNFRAMAARLNYLGRQARSTLLGQRDIERDEQAYKWKLGSDKESVQIPQRHSSVSSLLWMAVNARVNHGLL